jgi:hypothetical protein
LCFNFTVLATSSSPKVILGCWCFLNKVDLRLKPGEG